MRTLLLPAPFLLACTSLLDVDGEYMLASSGGRRSLSVRDGSAETASSEGTGGVEGGGGAGTGGSAGTGGDPGTGGEGGGPTCSAEEKLCPVGGQELCVRPDPSVGCGPTGCERCMPPVGGYPVCNDQACDFGCFDGFVRNGTGCDPVRPPEGGAGGSPGTGGAPGTCTKDTDCPNCGPAAGCCTLIPIGECGCNFVWCVPSPR